MSGKEGEAVAPFSFKAVDVAPSDETRQSDDEDEHDPHYEPLIHLPLVETRTLEEEEDVVWSARAKAYRYVEHDDDSAEWKERGVGVVKLLRHRVRGGVRVVMRREQTLKLCLNHYVLPAMELRPHASCSDRCWLWATPADFSDEQPRAQVVALRLKTTDLAMEFRERFNEGKSAMLAYQQQQDCSAAERDTAAGDAPTAADDLTKRMADATIGAAKPKPRVESPSP